MTTTATWIGVTGHPSGNWSIAADWSTGLVPTSTTAVTLDLAGSYGVTIGGAASAYSITINNAVTSSYLQVGAVLTVAHALTITSGVVDLYSDGVIKGGTISTGTNGSILYSGGTFSGVTYKGTLKLTATGASLVIKNGITFKAATGTGAGTLKLTGAGALLTVDNTTNLSNVTIDVGNDTAYSALDFNDTLSGAQILTLGATANLTQTGASFVMTTGSFATDQLVNKGSINLTEAGGNANISGVGSFTNAGSITVGTGNELSVGAGAGFTNNGTITIDSSGILFVEGNFTNGSTGVVNDISRGGFAAGGAITNNGTFNVSGKQEFAGNITGTGTIAIAADGQAAFDGNVASTQTIALAGASLLQFGPGFSGSISGLAEGDLILMTGIAAASAAISGSDLVVTPTTGSPFDIALSGTIPSGSTPVAAGSVSNDGSSLSLISIGGTTYTLTAGDTIAGGIYDNLILATAASLTSADNINAGTGNFNVMALKGAGSFNLAAPATLTGVADFLVSEGQAASGSIASTRQTITTRAGLTGTILVESPGVNNANTNVYGITINGAADSVTFDVESAQGADTINLGSGTESVKGSSWSGEVTTINAATAAEAGAQIVAYTNSYAGAAQTVLHVAVGGTITLNSNDQNMTVMLSSTGTTLNLGSLDFIIAKGGAGDDTIKAGGQGQKLSGGGGTNVLVGSVNGMDVFSDTSANLSHDTIKNFTSTDQIVATDMTYEGLTQLATWTQTSGTQGTLSFTDGTHSVAVTLTGTFTPGAFQLSANTAGTGVVATYL